ncbi:MAG: DUF6576 domain-containing protein [Bacteroidia bacterium]|nr:DUF6576 domain-containing protein [Bacteroidia bacterium]
MDVQKEIKDFLQRNKTVGWLIGLMIGGFLLQVIFLFVFYLLDKKPAYESLMYALTLPYSLKNWLSQPWSIITWPLFLARLDPLRLLVNGLILFAFGRIHQQVLGEQRTRRLVLLTVPLIGLMTITLSSLLTIEPTSVTPDPAKAVTAVTVTPNTFTEPDQPAVLKAAVHSASAHPNHLRPSGMIALIMVLVFSAVAVVPNYPIQLFLFGQVRIVWVGVILLGVELLWAGFFTPLGIALIIGAGLGFLHVFLLKRGTDITEIIWSYYQDTNPKPKMTVKYGSAKPETQKPGATKAERKNVVTQDIIDDILDKINDKGYESLTREEKELLFKASSQKEDEKKE